MQVILVIHLESNPLLLSPINLIRVNLGSGDIPVYENVKSLQIITYYVLTKQNRCLSNDSIFLIFLPFENPTSDTFFTT